MRFSLSWIKEFVEVTEGVEEIARRLTSVGLPVETVTAAPDGDAVLDIEVFPNRSDCMCIYGVAREVAAAFRRALCPYPGAVQETPAATASAALARVAIEAPNLCGRYTARVIQGVTVAPSPDWLARRLAAVGLRPVNNVVDATNYVLWEFGQPLHAFDLDTLQGREIRVRRARRGETIATLDGSLRTLDPEMLAIADAGRAVAIAGVMGGLATMVTEKTTNLLIESAHFDATSVRRTSKRLALSTDASYRFERGADIEATSAAANRVASLIHQVAGGSIAAGTLDVRPLAPSTRRVRLRALRVEQLLGIPVGAEIILRALRSLQFSAEPRADAFEVEVPSHRHDIEREVDLIEEVARHIGYENVPGRLPNIAGTGGVGRAGHRRERTLRRALEAAGCSEAITQSFATAAVDWGFRPQPAAGEPAVEPIALTNPIAADQEILRTTLLPGLLAAIAHNVNRGRRDARLYEIGHVFRRGQPGPPPHADRKHPRVGPVEESVALGLALTGAARPAHWMDPARETSFYHVKGLVGGVLGEARLGADFEPLGDSEALDPARSASVLCRVEGRRVPVGRLGAVARAWRERLDIRQEVFVAELDLAAIFSLPEKAAAFAPLPRYPSVSRDLSLVVGRDISYGDLEQAIRQAAPDRVVSVSVFDRYLGEALPAGTVGLSISIVYQHPERTLASEEAMELQKRILESLEGRYKVRLRE